MHPSVHTKSALPETTPVSCEVGSPVLVMVNVRVPLFPSSTAPKLSVLTGVVVSTGVGVTHLVAFQTSPAAHVAVPVTLGELAVGWATLPADSPRRRTYYAARRLRIVPITIDNLVSEPTGLIASFGVCRMAGIKGNDAWIAATAHLSAATLITYDTMLASRFATVGLSRLLIL